MASGIACLREKDTLLTHSIFPPKSLKRNWEISMETRQGIGDNIWVTSNPSRASDNTPGFLLLRNFQCLTSLSTSLLYPPFLPSSISPLLLCCNHLFPLLSSLLSLSPSLPPYPSISPSSILVCLLLHPTLLLLSLPSHLTSSLSPLLPVPYPFYLLS